MEFMLSQPRMKIIEELVAGSSRDELVWLNGYLSGLLANERTTDNATNSKPAVSKITIAYGTETGNSKKLALDFAAKAKKNGIAAKLVGLDQYRLNDLQKEEYFLTIVSTQGEGDPPAAAKKFYDHIHNNGFKLDKLKYSVLALGDTSYPLFCKAGEDVDAQLNKLGGKRIAPLQKCDTDYEPTAEEWFAEVLKQLSGVASSHTNIAPVVTKRSSGKKTYHGTVLSAVNLNDKGSDKETYHIEMAVEEPDYLPGDSLGIIPENPLSAVETIIKLIEIDPAKKFSFHNEQLSAFDLLKKKLNIVYLPERVVSKYAGLVGQDIPAMKIGLPDLLKIYPLKNSNDFEKLIELLEPIAPRLYSISSSPEAHNGELHITVARDKFCINEEYKYGLCSNYLAQFSVGSTLEFYIHKNLQFRLPANDKDVIMIGPGTGIAPFRSFIAHREATGAGGKNWLFFGDQHFVTDFLYQTEIQNWLETGTLTKVDLAFSRDKKEKIYVQHKMMKQAQEIYEWIESGAFVYLCGNKNPMSTDVENTLVHIVQLQTGKSANEAVDFLEQLKEEGRFVKDVY